MNTLMQIHKGVSREFLRELENVYGILRARSFCFSEIPLTEVSKRSIFILSIFFLKKG